MKSNIIQEKSFAFALETIDKVQELKSKGHYEIASQLLKSGTSIGANVEEAIGGSSRKDFINKINIAYKEARETSYWARLVIQGKLESSPSMQDYLSQAVELQKILAAILISSGKGGSKL
jgi:four helix bundle protein